LSENENIIQEPSTQQGYDIETSSINSQSYAFFTTSTNTQNISMENLQDYIKYPMIHNEILREISKQSYSLNGMYANTIDYMVSIPTLSFISVVRSKKEEIKNKRLMFNNLIRLLNHDKTTRDILRHLFIYGMYVGILRDTTPRNKSIDTMTGFIESIDRLEGLSLDDNFMIQPLDLDYVKFLGFQNNINVVGFDLEYFEQFRHGGLLNEIKNFPKEFLLAYNAYKKDSSKRWFILDYKKTLAIKFRSDIEEAYGRPLGLAAFCDMKSQLEYSNSQYKLINELASSIYYLILPEGERTGSCSLNQKQQDNVIDAFKNAVKINTQGDKAKISTLSLPPKTEIDKLTKDASLLKDTLSDEITKKISTNLGFASSALNASSDGGASYSSLQVNIDLVSSQVFQIVNEVAKEYTRLLNNLIDIKPSDYIEMKYLPISWLNKSDMSDKAKDLYLEGKGSLSFWIACSGFDVDDYISMMDYEAENDWENKYPIHMTSHTASSNDEGGAPTKNKLTPSGEKTKTSGANDNKKPSTNKK
jgi:hypothetical protein